MEREISVVERVLATSPAPITVDQLVAWNLVRPGELWRILDGARADGRIEEREPGAFLWRDEARRGEVLGSGSAADWAEVVSRPELIPLAVEASRRAREAGYYRGAGEILRALVEARPHGAFPGGERGWLTAVIDSIRLYRQMYGLSRERIEEAHGLAVELGDLPSQAVLAAALGHQAMIAGEAARAEEWFSAARQAAGALADPAVRAEVLAYVAAALNAQGRLREAIAVYEEMFGDVPADLLRGENAGWLDLHHPTPGSPLVVLALTWIHAGLYARAFDLLHRVVAVGRELLSPALEHQGRMMLAMAHVARDEWEAALPPGAEAFAYWSGAGAEPLLGWVSGSIYASALLGAGRAEEGRAVLAVAVEFRREAGWPAIAAATALRELDRAEAAGALPPGLEVEAELDRLLGWPSVFLRGAAHSMRAVRMSRVSASPEEAAEVDRHHREAVALLREAGALPELARALDEAAAWAEGRGRGEEAAAYLREAREVRAEVGGHREVSALGRVILELGRMGDIAGKREGVWGELAARLAGLLEAERIALAEVEDTGEGAGHGTGGDAGRSAGPSAGEGAGHGTGGDAGRSAGPAAGEGAGRSAGPAAGEGGGPAIGDGSGAVRRVAPDRVRLLAARGGGAGWQEEVRALLRNLPARPAASPVFAPAGAGRRALVPFESRNLGRRGWLVVESAGERGGLGPGDVLVVDALSVQLGVLLENVALWQELAAAKQRLEEENRFYRKSRPASAAPGLLVGDSPALCRVRELVERVAPSPVPVLITGETGVGKELVALELHRRSGRRDGPFIAVHVASMAPGLVASGLFGHERGAFTGATERVRGRFELAHGGTLFLDEIGELGPEDQVRLLRVLQEGTFERVGGTRPLRSDFRLVCATNRDLAALVRAGSFREDLYFRINVFPVPVPPLRERREEIPTLALYFMERVSRKLGARFEGISEADMQRLVAYPWPGNVRELEHLVERAALLSEPPRLRIPVLDAGRPASTNVALEIPAELVTMDEAERRHLLRVLRHTKGRITGAGGAAELLGMKPSTVNFRIRKLGLREDLARIRRNMA